MKIPFSVEHVLCTIEAYHPCLSPPQLQSTSMLLGRWKHGSFSWGI